MQNKRLDIDILGQASYFISCWEGLSLKPYKCAAGKYTIGYGHVISGKENLPSSITKKEANNLLEQDIRKAQYSLVNNVKVPLTIQQIVALISFIFNVGGGAFQRSILRQKLNRGEYRLAAEEFDKWIYAQGNSLKGLINRRQAEKKLFLQGLESSEKKSKNVFFGFKAFLLNNKFITTIKFTLHNFCYKLLLKMRII